MLTRVYYFTSSLSRPAISWFTDPKLQTYISEMKRFPTFQNLYYSDWLNQTATDFKGSPKFDLSFEICDLSNPKEIKFAQKLESPGIFCIFRKSFFPIKNHEFLREKMDDKAFIFFTDLDDTLFGNEEYLQEFYEHWIPNCLFDVQKKLIYTTGRSYLSFCKLEQTSEIIYPEYLICSNGTEIYHFDGETNEYKLDQEWNENIMINWNHDLVLKEFQNVSWLLPNHNSPHDSKSLRFYAEHEDIQEKLKDLEEIEARLAKNEIFISIYYSGHEKKRMLDVNSKRAGKGNASLYLMKKMGFKPEWTFGFGDSNNDLDLIRKCGKGILVGNSQKELLDFFTKNKDVETNIHISEFNYAKALLMELKRILD